MRRLGGRPLTIEAGSAVAIIAGVAVVAVAAIEIGPLAAATLLVGSVVVFVVPGYALVQALLPDAELSGLDRALAVVGSSIALTILTGIVLSLVGIGLTRATWLIGLLGLTVALGATAWWRLGRSKPTAPLIRVGLPRAGVSIRPLDAGLLALAVLLAATALGVARLGAFEQPSARFTELWLIPRGPATVEVGLQNQEAALTGYRVVLEDGSHIIGQWTPDVASGSTWAQVVPLSSPAPAVLHAVLYRASSPTQVYRSVDLTVAMPSPIPSASASQP